MLGCNTNILEVLTESDLPMLMVLLRPVADRWDIFCLQLGVMHTELRLIAANPTRMAGAPLTFLQDSLYAWLHGANGQCTISVLCDALRSEVVEEGVLSVTVEEKLKARRGEEGLTKYIFFDFFRFSVYTGP